MTVLLEQVTALLEYLDFEEHWSKFRDTCLPPPLSATLLALQLSEDKMAFHN